MTDSRLMPRLISLIFLASACTPTRHPVQLQPQAALGTSPDGPQADAWGRFMAQLDVPGPLVLQKHVAANWEVPRSGLINLDHPTAQTAELKDGSEPIEIYFYSLEHPKYGGYLIDSGVSEAFVTGKDIPVKFPLKGLMHLERLKVRLSTERYLASRETPIRGVFLTHLHLDHVLGLKDVPKSVPLYVGPEETEDRRFTHWLDRATTDANLTGFGPLRSWGVQQKADAPFAFVDLFGDGSALGVHAPGHTQGNMAFLLRTTEGPVLIAGDCSHTAWGWENSVEPGSFNTDTSRAAKSLDRLITLAQAHPTMKVHLGHQALPESDRPAPLAHTASEAMLP